MKLHQQRSLFLSHAKNIANVKGWKMKEVQQPSVKAWMRAEQLVRLDMIIFEYRDKFRTLWEPLSYRTVLNQLVFSRTRWTPSEISALSFAEVLLVLHEDLVKTNIPEEALVLPDVVTKSAHYEIYCRDPFQNELPPCSEEEWDPAIAEKLQDLRRDS